MTDPNGPTSDRPDDRRPFGDDRDGDAAAADQRDLPADDRPAGAPTDFGAADGPAIDFGGASPAGRDRDGDRLGDRDRDRDRDGLGDRAASSDGPAVDFGGPATGDGAADPAVPARAPGDDAEGPIAGDRDGRGGALPEADVDGEVVSTERTDADRAHADHGDHADRGDADHGDADRGDADRAYAYDPYRTGADRGTEADRAETERLDGAGVGLGAAATGGVGAAVAGGAADDRRPLHDDDALRAAEAHQAAPSDHENRVPPLAERHDGDRDRDRDREGATPVDGRDRGTDDRDRRDRDDREAPRVPAWSTGASGAAAGAGAGAGAAAGASGARPSGEYPLVHETNPDRATVRRQVLSSQRDEFGGMKLGAGLLGWFAATGFGVVLFAIFAAVVGGVVASTADGASRQQYLEDNAATGAITVAIAVGVIVLLGYFVGGYVASRMARFSGFKQGVAVFLWGVVISVVLTIVGLVVGAQGAGGPMGDMGRPFGDTSLLGSPALDAVVAVLVLLVLAFGGAVLGGLAGQRYHRRVDRFEPVEWPEQ